MAEKGQRMISRLQGTSKFVRARLSRHLVFVIVAAAIFLGPSAIPGLGSDLPFLFTVGIVLFAWFFMKWDDFKALKFRSNILGIAIGAALILSDLAENLLARSSIGLIDMFAIFAGLTIAFYGFKSVKFFWVPMVYIVILIVGYQAEFSIPDVKALEYSLAGLMSSFMQLLGVKAAVYQNVVALYGQTTLYLQVDGPCTGLKGILAFGMLSSMTLLDTKLTKKKMIPLLAIGFVGAFLINFVRLAAIFVAFEYLGTDIGTTFHVYLGYSLFIAWVLIFWSLAFRYMVPRPSGRTLPVMNPVRF
jgi:exosortase/archaeosortase family protein